jgi:NIMA (never in mitosis gene a)-related kinase 1/4/5
MYIKKKILGKGAYGKVYLVLNDKNKKLYALKSMGKDKSSIISFDTEIKLLKKLDHENVVKLYDFFENQTKLNIILEFAENGTLSDLIRKYDKNFRKFNETEVKNVIVSIAKGLDHLHQNKIIHRDIKPENILVTKDNIYKISDFGVSRLDNKTKMINTSIGTPYYMAPELIKGRQYNNEVDCWALGCIFYELFTFKPPFDGNNLYVLSARICRGYISLHQIPLDYRTIIRNLLNINNLKRSTINEVLTFYENVEIKEKKPYHFESRMKNIKKNYVSPYRYNNIPNNNINKNNILPKIQVNVNNNNNIQRPDYRKKNAQYYNNLNPVDNYYKNRKPFFY